MKFEQRVNVDVPDAVPIGDHKGLVLQPFSEPQQPAARHGTYPRVDHSDAPVDTVAADNVAGAVLKIDEVVVGTGEITVKILFNAFALITARHEKILEAVSGINFHDVPE